MTEVRALYKMKGYLYTLNGATFIKIAPDLTQTVIGNIPSSTTGAAWIRGDGTKLAVVDESRGYFWDGAFQYMSLPFSPTPSSMAYQDGYFIVSESGSGRFYISGLYDPNSWDALDYATKEGFHDNLLLVHSQNRDLWLFGEETTEIWYNSGEAFPFTRYNGGFINIGLKAKRSVAGDEVRVFWLDNNLRIRMGTGIQSQIVSTPQIDYQISLLSNHDQAVGFYYFMEGHGFYQITIDTQTFVYDVTTGFWHKRSSGDSDGRHPAQCYAYFNDKHLVGHYDSGKLLWFDPSVYTNDGETMKAIRAAQSVHSDEKEIFHSQLQVQFEGGYGGEVDLDWSDDGGHTWSSKHTVSLGASGEYASRAVWRRLGRGRNRVYRITIDDPVKRVITGADLEATRGAS